MVSSIQQPRLVLIKRDVVSVGLTIGKEVVTVVTGSNGRRLIVYEMHTNMILVKRVDILVINEKLSLYDSFLNY